MDAFRLHSRTGVALMVSALLFSPVLAFGQDAEAEIDAAIQSAVSAAPTSVSDDARVIDWSMNELRAGSNGWTCLPDRPDTEETDPWCVDEPWLDFLHAYMTQAEPSFSRVGIAYMMQGDAPVSNSDPYASEPTGEDDWVTDVGAHLMVIVPDPSALEGMSTDHRNGGPWVMWPDTPYAHIMIPVESR